MSVESNTSHGERLKSLETWSANFQSEFIGFRSEIRSTLGDIQKTVSQSRETNWSLIIAGCIAIGSLWAAAIKPLNDDLKRQEVSAKSLADMVSKANEMQFANKNEMSRLASEVGSLQRDFTEVRLNGSPVTDKRLTLLEHHISELKSEPK